MILKTSGAYTAGLDLSGAGVVQVSVNGGAYANRLGAAPTSFGGGDYYYIPDNSEVPAAPGKIFLKVVLTNYEEVHTMELVDDSVIEAITDIQTSVTNSTSTITASVFAAQTALAGDITSAVSTIDGNTDSDVTAAQTAITSAITSATTTLSNDITTSQGVVTGAITASETTIVGDITSAVSTIDASTSSIVTSTVTAAEAAILAAIPSASHIRDVILDEARQNHLSLGSIGEGIALATSLLQGNFMIDNVANSVNGPTSQRIRCWTSSAAMAGATSGGSGEGEFATFQVTTSYSGPSRIQTHKVVQQ